MKQLRLFEFFGIDILAKIVKERKTRKEKSIANSWNGEPW